MSKQCINDIHLRLKQETHLAHRELDQHKLLVDLISDQLTPSLYILTLVSLKSWFERGEHVSQSLIDNLGSLSYLGSKSTLIDTDLSLLGYKSVPNQNPSLVDLSQVITNQYTALGLLYVMEGSTLGGSVIAPRVSKTLDLDHATSFYDCYGKDKFSNFTRTMRFIQSSISSQVQANKVVEGALNSFKSLRKHLDEQCKHHQHLNELAAIHHSIQ